MESLRQFIVSWTLDHHLAGAGRNLAGGAAGKGYGDLGDLLDPEDETFAQGLPEDDWIIDNVDWLTDLFFDHAIPLETDSYRQFYQAVNKQDWRCTSCAGCM